MANYTLTVNTNLFPDSETVFEAVKKLEDDIPIKHLNLFPDKMVDEDWDKIIKEIISVEKLIII